MRLIYEPFVCIVGRQVVDQYQLSKFLEGHELTWESDSSVGSEVLMEVAGRLCYMSFAKPRPGGNEAYLRHIKESGHGSVLEHSVWNLVIEGVSRSLTHELVRHRAGMAYSQLSQRYVDESVCEVVVPLALRDEVTLALDYLSSKYGWKCTGDPARTGAVEVDEVHTYRPKIDDSVFAELDLEVGGSGEEKESKVERLAAGLEWLRCVQTTSSGYKSLTDYLMNREMRKLIESKDEVKTIGYLPDSYKNDTVNTTQEERTAVRKEARQAARSVLPNCTETKIFVTANGRALRHFVEMRCSRFADSEIRTLAGRAWELLSLESPNLFGDYERVDLPDGTFELTTKHRKV